MKLDTDNSGFVEMAELDPFLRGIYQPTDSEVGLFLQKFDRNNDHAIEWEVRMRVQSIDICRTQRPDSVCVCACGVCVCVCVVFLPHARHSGVIIHKVNASSSVAEPSRTPDSVSHSNQQRS